MAKGIFQRALLLLYRLVAVRAMVRSVADYQAAGNRFWYQEFLVCSHFLLPIVRLQRVGVQSNRSRVDHKNTHVRKKVVYRRLSEYMYLASGTPTFLDTPSTLYDTCVSYSSPPSNLQGEAC
jgi:hypothetical protein